ncbi:hypothetical protein ACH5RR_027167 [Cinchona calisaya]|uniref:DUF4283 domain-containing protein n=1 Tax=Cinchona calisaya TaxID=153742 RepID=A0ABD2Z7Z0_9GENT
MANDIIKSLRKFSLFAKELGGADLVTDNIRSSMADCEKSLFGKVIGDKSVNLARVRNLFSQVWGSLRNFKVHELGEKNCNLRKNNHRKAEAPQFGSWLKVNSGKIQLSTPNSEASRKKNGGTQDRNSISKSLLEDSALVSGLKPVTSTVKDNQGIRESSSKQGGDSI